MPGESVSKKRQLNKATPEVGLEPTTLRLTVAKDVTR